jgi:4'-phosphopantetheinyl transferase EntD
MRLTFIRRGSSITSLKKNAREFNSSSAKLSFCSKGSIFKSAYQYLESVNRGSIFQARINSTNSKSRRIDRFASFCRFANPEVLQIGKNQESSFTSLFFT